MAVEKRVTSPLMAPSSIEKILEVDSHVGGPLVMISTLTHSPIALASYCV